MATRRRGGTGLVTPRRLSSRPECRAAVGLWGCGAVAGHSPSQGRGPHSGTGGPNQEGAPGLRACIQPPE